MGQFREKLEALAQGQSKPSQVKEWLTAALDGGDPPLDELKADLDGAGDLGLPDPILDAYRGQILKKQASTSSMDFELSLEGDDAPAEPASPEAEQPEEASTDAGSSEQEPSLELPDDEPSPDEPDWSLADDSGADDSGGDDDATLLMEDSPAAEDDEATVAAGPAGDEDDPDATEIVSDDDATMRMEEESTSPGGAEATQVMGDDDATQVVGDDDATQVMEDDDATLQGGGDDMDPFSMADAPSGPTGGTGTSWPTGTGWPQSREGGPESIGPGTILKQRFELMEKLGEGGMGAVYKARDLLKVEAKDRNPYVAVKLLSGDFKEHPEAFISLQRESSKAQKLAHPNIATVYDFDRDGSTVYMTMEVLEGLELNQFIKKEVPDGGLSVEEAMPIIQQLCDGLRYAHDRGLVHSDFKPGNAFIQSDGTVKLLDFGIARASQTKSDAEGEKTLFDPGALGALTPAYATVEMFEGLEPDPRDDIYALACTVYELLNKTHPFKKRSAVKVKELGLSPEPLKKLNRRQNRILMQGLAVTRDGRPDSVEEFWEQIRPRKDYRLQIAAGGTVLALLVGGLAYGPIMDFIQDRKNAEVVQLIQAGQYETAFSTMDEFPPDARRDIADATYQTLVDYFNQQAYQHWNPAEDRFDHEQAQAVTQTMADYIGERDVEVQNLQSQLTEERQSLISDLTERYNELIESGTAEDLLPDPDDGDREMPEVLERLSMVAPDHELLGSTSLATRYRELADEAFDAGELQRASEILDIAMTYTPDNPGLVDVRAKTDRAIRQQQDAAEVAELESTLAQARDAGLETYADYEAVVDELARLSELRPEHPLVAELTPGLKQTMEALLEERIASGNFAAAEAALSQVARATDIPWLLDQRDALSRAEVDAAWQPEDIGTRLTAVGEARQKVEQLLADPQFTETWDTQLRMAFRELIAQIRPGNAWIEDLRRDAAETYAEHASGLIEEDLFNSARQAMVNGERYLPDYSRWAQLETDFQDAREEYEAFLAEQERIENIGRFKTQLSNQVQAGQPDAARQTLAQLRDLLPEGDPYLTQEAPRLLAQAYLGLARNVAERDPDRAQQLIDAGRDYADIEGFAELEARIPQERRRMALFRAAEQADADDVQSLAQQRQRVLSDFPDRAQAIDNEFLQNLRGRIQALSRSDLQAAHALKDAALANLGNPGIIRNISLDDVEIPSEFAPQVVAAIETAELTRATDLLEQGRESEGEHPELDAAEDQLNRAKQQAEQIINTIPQAMARGQSTFRRTVQEAQKLWADNPTVQQYAERLGTGAATGGRQTADDGSVLCTESLAGLAGSAGSRAACFDMIGGSRGPQMVVVPPGPGGEAFAIGRTEVTIGDYNNFCQATGRCSTLAGNENMPATGISLADAQAYVEWLNTQTGKDYRIPSMQEWRHAAAATDADANAGNYNCRFEQDGAVLKGSGLLQADLGQSNDWGLINYVGNAQEWVRAQGGFQAAGGAFEDPMTSCSVSLAKNHGGQADSITGFRVARSLD